jgi:hypothetical protein
LPERRQPGFFYIARKRVKLLTRKNINQYLALHDQAKRPMLQEGGTWMKRVVLLILVLLLVIDLADGCLGKATFVAPDSAAKTSLTSPLDDCPGKVDSSYTLPSPGGEIYCLLPYQPVTPLVQPALKIIISNHTGSSGGLPL